MYLTPGPHMITDLWGLGFFSWLGPKDSLAREGAAFLSSPLASLFLPFI